MKGARRRKMLFSCRMTNAQQIKRKNGERGERRKEEERKRKTRRPSSRLHPRPRPFTLDRVCSKVSPFRSRLCEVTLTLEDLFESTCKF